jgi:hypothetical protein
MILPGSYANGFAPRDGQPLYPELWRGCVGAWNPGLGPTGLTLLDWAANQTHGTLTNGPTWTISTGKLGVSADGVDDHIAITRLSVLDAPYTVSAWITVRTLNASNNTTFFQTASQEFGFNSVPGGGFLWTRRSGSYNPIATGPSVTAFLGIPVHVCVTMTAAKTVAYYVKGVSSITSGNANMSIYDVSIPAVMRLVSTGLSTRVFDGVLHDSAIYSRALSPYEVRLLASRPGIAYELAPRRRSRIFTSGFRAYWAARKAQIIGGGL